MKCRVKIFAVILFLLFSSPDLFASPSIENLISEAKELHLSEKPQWLNLLHYRPALRSKYKSQADGLSFFLAGKKGIRDPEAELEATLQGFFEPLQGAENHPQCHFPARYLWLQSQLHWDAKTIPPVKCEKFEAFKKRMNAQSVTLVFSSYYLNNPSSMYGHTFLRFNKAPSSLSDQHQELLDYGINYAAVMTTQNPVLYAIMGLSGLFQGTFTSIPYYYKVREYTDFESRDLWEYDLHLTKGEMQMMVAHLWELGSTYFDYYYLSENCSYHMLTLLDAAAPQYSLANHLSFYVIPTDTLKVVHEAPGLVTRIHYRPSVESQFNERVRHLSDKEKKLLHHIISHQELRPLPESLASERRVAILDAALDGEDIKYGARLIKKEEAPLKFKQALLIARSQLAISSPPLTVPIPNQRTPHKGHGSARTGLDSGFSSQKGPYLRLSHRFAFHDLLDPSTGYPESMEIDFFKVDLRYNFRDHSVWPENINAINILSLPDYTEFHPSLSWKLRVGSTVFRDENCSNCLGGIADGGVGITKRAGDFPFWATLTLDGEVSGAPDFTKSFVRLRVGPMAQLRTSLKPNLQILIKSQYRHSVVPDFSSNLESLAGLRWEFVKNIALNLQTRHFWHPQFWEGDLGIFVYY